MADSNNKNQTVLFAIIGILALALVAETGYLAYNHFYKPESQFTKPKIRHQREAFLKKMAQAGPAGKYAAQNPWDDPFAELEQMRQGMNRLFNAVRTYGPPLASSMTGESFLDFVPAFDIEDLGDTYLVQGDLPGLEKDKIDILVQGKLLTIKGVRESTFEEGDDSSGFYAQERSYGSFSRTLTLPGSVDESGVIAEYTNGVLSIQLPKTQDEVSGQKIPVQ